MTKTVVFIGGPKDGQMLAVPEKPPIVFEAEDLTDLPAVGHFTTEVPVNPRRVLYRLEEFQAYRIHGGQEEFFIYRGPEFDGTVDIMKVLLNTYCEAKQGAKP